MAVAASFYVGPATVARQWWALWLAEAGLVFLRASYGLGRGVVILRSAHEMLHPEQPPGIAFPAWTRAVGDAAIRVAIVVLALSHYSHVLYGHFFMLIVFCKL